MIHMSSLFPSRFLSMIQDFFGRRVGISAESAYFIYDHIARIEFDDDQTVLFSDRDRRTILVNNTASAVLKLTDGRSRVRDIARQVASDYGILEDDALRDIRRIYRDLLLKGIIAMKVDALYIPRLKNEIVVRQEDDGAFIFDSMTDELSAVNETGSLVLDHMNGKNSVAAIVEKIKSLYPDQEQDAVRRDVETFVEQLKERGFIAD
jgi:hypothetical protein